MGWSYGELDGREVGYGVDATCDRESCDEQINRGMAYRCGESYSEGCGRYFCYEHLMIGPCEHPTMWDDDSERQGGGCHGA